MGCRQAVLLPRSTANDVVDDDDAKARRRAAARGD
jgi:hypothetical protein